MNSYRSDLFVTARKLKSPAALSAPAWLLAGVSALALLFTCLGCETPRHTDKDGHTGKDEQADPDVTLPKLATIEGKSGHFAFAPDGKSLAVGNGAASTIKVYKVPSAEEVHALESDLPPPDKKGFNLDGLCFSRDGKSIAAACGWQGVKVWDAATGKLRPGVNVDPRFYLQTVEFTPDGKSLITTDSRAILKYWDLATEKEEAQFALGAGIHEMSYSPDGKMLAMRDGGDTLKLWDVAKKKEIRSWKVEGGLGDQPWSADGKRLATTPSGVAPTPEGRGVHVWDAASGKDLGEVAKGGGDSVRLAFAPKGNLLAVVKIGGSVVIHDATTYEKLAVLREDPKVNFLAFSPDGKVLATAAPSSPPAPGAYGATKLWDTSKLAEREAKRKP